MKNQCDERPATIARIQRLARWTSNGAALTLACCYFCQLPQLAIRRGSWRLGLFQRP